jgi:hypothetical protein|tara:strand:+ start:274 stop:417 length:144 start_codon:yes stop_codon:yes gene_type:complete
MFKAMIYMLVGFSLYYLFDGGDVQGLAGEIKLMLHQAASSIASMTAK